MDLLHADQVDPLPVEWLWKKIVPKGMLSLFVGRPGEGKSMFAAFLAAEISNRGQVVLFSNREDPVAQVIRPRLEAAGADLKMVQFYTPPPLPEGLAALAEVVQETKASLMIIDPIASHLRASIYNDQEVRTALDPLAMLAAETGCAFVFIHHVVKSAPTSAAPLRSVGGSGGGLPGAARAVYVFGKLPGNRDDRFLAPIKYNLDKWPNAVEFEIADYEFTIGKGRKQLLLSAGYLEEVDDDSIVTGLAILLGDKFGVTGVHALDSKRATAAAWLTMYLSLGPRPAKEVREDATQNAHTWKTIRNCADDIEVVKERKGFGKDGAWHWRLPDGHPALIASTNDDDDDSDGNAEPDAEWEV